MTRYRYLEHTSDLGMEIFGRDLPELFRNAAFAVFDSILNLDQVTVRESQTVELRSTDRNELFLDWLREVLYRFATDYFIVREVGRLSIQGACLHADLSGERFDPKRHRVKIEIKTPTYHMYRITEAADGYMATVIFDV